MSSGKGSKPTKEMTRTIGGGRRNGCSLDGEILASTLRVALKGIDQNVTVNFTSDADGNSVHVTLTNNDGKPLAFPASDE